MGDLELTMQHEKQRRKEVSKKKHEDARKEESKVRDARKEEEAKRLQQEENFEAKEAVDVETVSPMHSFFFAVAFLVTLLPIYLYTAVFNMGAEHKGLFVVVTFGSTIIMMLAYQNVAQWTELRFSEQRNGTRRDKHCDRYARALMQQEQKRRDTQRSVAFAIAYNNTFFLFVVCFLGFFIMHHFCAPFNYVVSVSGSAATVFFQSIQE